ncbi:MAG: hypothetical protein JSR71_10210 [Proteobacteria bacterium]|nr:hypothetical protein [Pseudomonadota bacterium]
MDSVPENVNTPPGKRQWKYLEMIHYAPCSLKKLLQVYSPASGKASML